MASSLAGNSIANGIAGIATTLAGVVSTIIIARTLGVEATGVVAFAVWIVTYMLLAADLGVPGSLTRYVAAAVATGRKDQATGISARLFWPFLLVNGAAAAALIGYGVWLAVSQTGGSLAIHGENYRMAPLFWCLAGAAFLAQALANFSTATLRAQGRFKTLSSVAAISAVLQVASTFIGAWLFGIAGALTGAVIGYLIPAVMAPALAGRGGAVAPEVSSRIKRYAIESWFGLIVTAFAWSRMEVVFLEHAFGSETVGLFAAALTLTNIATQGPMLLTGALMPFFARKSAIGEHADLKTHYASVMRLFTLAVAPACLGLAAISGEVITLLFGESFASAAPAAAIMLTAAAVTVPGSLSTIYLLALEKTRTVLLFAAIGAVLIIAAGLLVIPAYGGIGAAVSRAIIQMIVVGAGVWYAATRLNSPLPLGSLARIFMSAAVMAICAFLVANQIGGVAGALVGIAAGVIIYALMLRLTRALSPTDARYISQAIAFLPPKIESIAARVLAALQARPASDF